LDGPLRACWFGLSRRGHMFDDTKAEKGSLMRKLMMSLIIMTCAAPAMAQSTLLAASPVPENAEKRFCYYAGLTYSENAFILMTGSNTVTETTRNTEERLLRCHKGDDGVLSWKPESTMQLGR